MQVEPAQGPAPRRVQLRMVLLSFLLLFLELALIKWSGENIVLLSYFTNFVLLGSFLGIGLGFLRANRRVNLFPYAPVVLAGLVAFVRFFPVQLTTSSSNLIYFGNIRATGPPREVVLTIIFVAVATVMMLVSEGVARTFKQLEPLDAYRLDLVGSILGILAFSLLSLLSFPSLAWGVVVAVLLFGLVYTYATPNWLRVAQVVSLGTMLILLALESFAPNISWSPYYKIKTVHQGGASFLSVNGVLHQANIRATGDPIYSLVYGNIARKHLDNVLVIGAGGGNDVAVALARGARHVDAVEIDPRIVQIGKETHPDHPYENPRVSIHVTDGRAFLEQTHRRYDLILLALTDSLTLVQGQSSVRLESYLFTKQSIEAARDRLKPGGVFSMYNFYRTPWLLDRMGGTLNQVFDHRPCSVGVGAGSGRFSVLVDAPNQADLACQSVWKPSGAVPAAATDDHPFPYLRTPSIPALYIVTDLLILAFSLLAVGLVAGKVRTIASAMASYLDLFFLGVAFLLLETKNVVQFALLFGTTWTVNALVFLGILLTVLLAVELCRRVTFKHPARFYVLLLASLLLAWIVSPASLLALSPVPRFFAGTALAFAPIFFANIIFSNRFKGVGSSTTAFAVNLLGAMVGGLLEYTTLVIGYRSLLIIVAAAYAASFYFGRSHLLSRRAAVTT